MSQLVTRCPHCSTSFHVNEQQLRAARGAVRCGSCLQVFRADENIVFGESEPETGKELESLLEDDDILIHDDMDSAPDDEDTSSPTAAPGNRSQRDANGDDPLIGDAFGDSEWQDIAAAPEAEDDDDDDIEESAALRSDPDDDPWNIGDAPEPPARSEAAASELWDRQHRPQQPRDGFTDQLHSSEAHSAGRNAPEELSIRPERDRLISAIEPAPVEVDWRPRRDRRIPGWLWPLLALLLLVGIIAQIGYYRFDSLSKREPWRSLYAQACPLLDCKLPPQVDLGAIRTSNLVVRSHPKITGALVVDAVLQNSAPFAQPFPSLQLNFTDLKNRPVASRRFEPRDYLQGELAGRSQMPSGSPVHIAIEIADPGSEAVNYELHIAR